MAFNVVCLQPQNVNKSSNFSNQKSDTQISFVSKPALFEGKTIARKRKHEPNVSKSVNFSLLNQKQNDTKPSAAFVKTQQVSPIKEKKKENFKEEEKTVDFPDKPDGDFSINTVNDKKAKKHDKKKNKNNDDNYEKKERKPRNNEAEPPQKKSIHAQISALFRNNPEIPKIGQRLVKPINERVFSGLHFENLNIHSFSIANLEKNMGLKQLTVVQQKASPVILEGRDVLVR